MRIGNLEGRLALIVGDRALDVEKASGGTFGPDPQDVFRDWDGFSAWAGGQSTDTAEPFDPTALQAPVPRPPQVFGIGLNYHEHAVEAGLGFPDEPQVFTKFPSSVTGPHAEVVLPGNSVDWEVELVVVVGREAHGVGREQAWDHVAGYMVGQDISEREVQLRGPAPQFSMGKSFPGFSPTGPYLVSRDEIPDPGTLDIGCSIDGTTMQHSNTRELIFDIPELIHRLSAIVTLLPGDLIFTGTPSGIGNARTPQRFLQAGEELVSHIEDIGQIHTRFVDA
jgi:2,4-didehydro-3-deoxy-L-rhamnonate hydrolase